LFVDGLGKAAAERTDGNERSDAERDREGKQKQPPSARAAITPRHLGNKPQGHRVVVKVNSPSGRSLSLRMVNVEKILQKWIENL
jgi:hypothetical protein